MSDTTKNRSGCAGCGGYGPCDCGYVDCGDCITDGIVRPQFFAGQLLTEDDLSLLTSYVTTKGRLHNRHLHGSGVVCGLEVTCHPCDGGRVTVQPGYALDCCGNDIYVPCPTELDVNAMIYRLRTERLGGYDCGDPCAEKGREALDGDDGEKPRSPLRRYCLYVRYCESPSDPVVPYATEEPCGASACEPTRVREGFRFELRCEEQPPPETIADRLRDCFGELREFRALMIGATIRRELYARDRRALAEAARTDVPAFGEAEFGVLQASLERLSTFVKAWEARGADDPQPGDDELRGSLDDFRAVAQGVALGRLAQLATDARVSRAMTRSLSQAPAILETAAGALRTLRPRFTDELEGLLLEATLEQGLHWAGERTEDERRGFDGRYFVFGGLSTAAFRVNEARALAQLRDWLLCRLDGTILTDCGLRDEVHAIEIGETTGAQISAGARLLAALLRYLRACLCRALLPPCPPCEDPAVLLACLTIRDCEVVDICNLERTFVLSWPAMRYWIPQLGTIGEAFERFCCTPLEALAPSKPAPDRLPTPVLRRTDLFGLARRVRATAETAGPLPDVLAFVGGEPTGGRAAEQLLGGVASFVRDPGSLAAMPLPMLGASLSGDQLRTVREEVARDLGTRLDELQAENAALKARIEGLEGSRS